MTIHSTTMNNLLDLFQYDFMIRAFIAGVAVALVAPTIGTFLVVRRYSLMADTLAHVSLVGVAIGLVTKTQPVLIAIIAAIIAAIGIEKLRGTKRVFGESILALFLSGSLAIASVIISAAGGFNMSLLNFLFGSITTVTQLDVFVITAMSLIILLTIIIFFNKFFLVSFDEELARTDGIRAKAYSTLLVVLAAVTVALSMRIVGVLLIGALMVIPVITAIQFSRGFRATILLSVAISLIAVVVGLLVSYYFSLASGGTIVVVALLLFLLSIVLNKKT
jgi:zinc transport system permease protein